MHILAIRCGQSESDWSTIAAMTAVSQETIFHTIVHSSLGGMLMASTEKGICCVMFDDYPERLERELKKRFPRANVVLGDTAHKKTVDQLLEVVDQPRMSHSFSLDVRGTAFQKSVWRALQNVPAGTTATYLDIARSIRRPKAVRAVARACGANNISVLIPCHRIIKSDGSLSGYRWGKQRKKELLQRESTFL